MSSSTADTNKTLDLPQIDSIETTKIRDLAYPLMGSTKGIITNPGGTYASLNTYDTRLHINPHPVRSLHSFRLNKTKRDKEKETVSLNLDVILTKGQTYPLKSAFILSNTITSLSNSSFSDFHTNKQVQQANQNKNNIEQQRSLSTTKVLTKRNAIAYEDDDIIDEKNKVPNEKQQHQHKGNAFNDTTNGNGNETNEHSIISRKHLKVLSDSNVETDQGPLKLRQLSVEVNIFL